MLEAVKGGIVLLVGFGALELIGRNVQHLAEEVVQHFYLNPANRFPRIFLHLAQQATPFHLWALAAGALGYAAMRFVEAYGLWRERTWAQWFGVLSGGFYLPMEVWRIMHHATWLCVIMIVANLVVVLFLGLKLIHR